MQEIQYSRLHMSRTLFPTCTATVPSQVPSGFTTKFPKATKGRRHPAMESMVLYLVLVVRSLGTPEYGQRRGREEPRAAFLQSHTAHPSLSFPRRGSFKFKLEPWIQIKGAKSDVLFGIVPGEDVILACSDPTCSNLLCIPAFPSSATQDGPMAQWNVSLVSQHVPVQ